MINLSDIKKIFVPKSMPTADQFWDTFTSFWHKSEKLPQTQVMGLNEALNDKASKTDLKNIGDGFRPMGSVDTEAQLRAIVAPNDNDSYFVKETKDENGDPYIWRFDANLTDWVNTEQVVYQNVAKKRDLNNVELFNTDYILKSNIGLWQPRTNGGVLGWDSVNNCMTITVDGSGNYFGARIAEIYGTGRTFMCSFEARAISGTYNWKLTNGSDSGDMLALSGNWQRFVMPVTLIGNQSNITFLQVGTNEGVLGVRNFLFVEQDHYGFNMLNDLYLGINNVYNRIDAEITDRNYLAVDGIGNWRSRPNGGILAWDSINKYMTIESDGSKQYQGAEITESKYRGVGREFIVSFEAKVITGTSNWVATSGSADVNEVIQGLSNEWQQFTIKLNPFGAVGSRITIQTAIVEAGVLAIRNFYFAEKGYFSYSVLDFYLVSDLVKDYEKEISNPKYGSLDARILDKKVTDIGLPSWVGKSELRTTDLMPSINNQGQSYIREIDGVIYHCIVIDALRIVRIPVADIITNSVTPKSFSICYFGDSITAGSASTSYVGKLNSKLTADGHTITKTTNKAIGGQWAETYAPIVAALPPEDHDFACLMIGTNDAYQWIKRYSLENSDNLNPVDFRKWYRENMLILIQNIKDYSSCTKFFLIAESPRTATKDSNNPTHLACIPLLDIVAQECIDIASNDNIIHLCRADYYVQPIDENFVDGVHLSELGSDRLAKGLRNEITFRV